VAEELVRLLPALVTKAGFFNPYRHGLGGGEKYLYTILEEAVRTPGVDVTLFSPEPPAPQRWEELNVRVDPGSFRWRAAGPLGVTRHSRGLDLFVAIANHIPPLSLARHSAVIMQFPFTRLRDPGGLPRPLWPVRAADRRLRLRSYDTVLCYSEFVRRALVERLELPDPVVLPPPVDTAGVEPGPKGRSLIAVGRFFPAVDSNNKKHDVLIDAFRRLTADPRADGWTLHLAGGCRDDAASQAYLQDLRRRADGLPVQFHPNVSRETLAGLYGQSPLFWHAAGHGERLPERFEHFGITTVEAMAHGCVPVVPALGGQLEVVQDRVDGRLWRSVDELVAITAELMSDPETLAALGAAAARDAGRFSRERFLERVRAELIAPATGNALAPTLPLRD
jgi:glycosyltransferase involved in cell wall biosynthesis